MTASPSRPTDRTPRDHLREDPIDPPANPAIAAPAAPAVLIVGQTAVTRAPAQEAATPPRHQPGEAATTAGGLSGSQLDGLVMTAGEPTVAARGLTIAGRANGMVVAVPAGPIVGQAAVTRAPAQDRGTVGGRGEAVPAPVEEDATLATRRPVGVPTIAGGVSGMVVVAVPVGPMVGHDGVVRGLVQDSEMVGGRRLGGVGMTGGERGRKGRGGMTRGFRTGLQGLSWTGR